MAALQVVDLAWGTVSQKTAFAGPMSKFAVIVPNSRRTRDHRIVRWLECELHDDDIVVRDPNRAFFTMEAASSWAQARGYEVRR